MFTNKTSNYNLPQYLGTDKAEWLDNNTAFDTIDKTMKENAVNATSALSSATAASASADRANTAASNARATADEALNNAAENATNISGLTTRVETLESRTSNLSAAIGTNKFVTLKQSEYDALGVKDANTVYFVTADSE